MGQLRDHRSVYFVDDKTSIDPKLQAEPINPLKPNATPVKDIVLFDHLVENQEQVAA